jgi:hypothetical protein
VETQRVRIGEEFQLTIRLHTDRIEMVVEFERLLAAGEAGRYADKLRSHNGKG